MRGKGSSGERGDPRKGGFLEMPVGSFGIEIEGYDAPLRGGNYIMESLILAQNERWRRVLSMQVERQLG